MLREKLTEISSASADKIPAETVAVMAQAKKNLAASGIMNETIKVGEQLPDFLLEDGDGKLVSLAGLKRHGPVLLTVYRGMW